MKNKTNRVVQQVMQLIEPILNEMDVELVDVEFLSVRSKWVLRIFVDEQDGITLDRCAQVSKEIGTLIDMKDIVEHEYVLEVSSPGLNRPLKKVKDFIWATGKKVTLKTVSPVNGRRKFTGILKSFNEGALAIQTDNDLVSLPLINVEKANLVYEFEK